MILWGLFSGLGLALPSGSYGSLQSVSLTVADDYSVATRWIRKEKETAIFVSGPGLKGEFVPLAEDLHLTVGHGRAVTVEGLKSHSAFNYPGPHPVTP